MPTIFTYISLAVSFFAVFISIKHWIKTAHKLGFTGIDLNKYEKTNVAEAGGICLVLGFIIGCFLYIGFLVFFYQVDQESVLFLFAAITTILLAGLIGFVDDILGWRIGLKKSCKVILTLFIPLPIMVINAGHSIMAFPLFGEFDFGILFPLVLVPIAIIGTTNGFNMLAGYNGLEAGLGVIILSSLGFLSHMQGEVYLSGFCAMIVASLLGFLYFNKHPARIFPGDSLTYSVGAMIGVVAILSNIEKFTLILFVPYFCELILKGRAKFEKASWSTPSKNNSLKNKYGKWYGLPNVAISLLRKIKGRAYEPEVVVLVCVFQLGFACISFLSYFNLIPV